MKKVKGRLTGEKNRNYYTVSRKKCHLLFLLHLVDFFYIFLQHWKSE